MSVLEIITEGNKVPLICGMFFTITALATVGCQNPSGLRQMAKTTSAAVISIQSGIGSIEAESQRVADARAANVARLHVANAEYEATLRYESALESQVGKNPSDVEAKLKKWSTLVTDLANSAEGEERAFREKLEKQRTALERRRNELAAVARMLAELGTEEEFKDRLTFVAMYLAAVGQDVEKRLDAAKANTEATEATIDAKTGDDQ